MSHRSEYFYGDKICDGKNKKCIRDLSPTTIAEMCRECSKYERCNLVFYQSKVVDYYPSFFWIFTRVILILSTAKISY